MALDRGINNCINSSLRAGEIGWVAGAGQGAGDCTLLPHSNPLAQGLRPPLCPAACQRLTPNKLIISTQFK